MNTTVLRKEQPGGALRRAAMVLLMAFAVLSAAMPAAFAHASLIAADPADGSVLPSALRQLSLTFSEPVSPLVLKLVQPDGSTAALEKYALQGNRLDIETGRDLGQGTFVLSWRVVSEDGHPIGGSVIFSIGQPSVSPPASVETVNWSVRTAILAARTTLYVSLFLGVGGIFAAAWLARGKFTQIPLLLVLLGLPVVPLSVGLQGVDALGVPLGGLWDGAVWKAGFATSFGRTALLASGAFVAALGASVSTASAGRGLSLLAMVGVGSALAASGHASAAEPQWLTRPTVFLHGVAIAFWAGALLPLGLALRRHAPGAVEGLRRFSKSIPFVVAILIVAGFVLAVIQVGTPSALADTAYGRVLMVKLVLLTGLFSLAAFNRWTLTEAVEGGDASATRSMVKSIAAETLLMIAIFAVAACWRFTPPPRVLAIEAALPASIHIHQADAMADLTVTPGRAGRVDVSMVIMTGDFGPLDAKQVTLVLSNPQAGIEPFRREAQKPGDGTWRIEGLSIPVAGKWSVRIDVLISDFQMAKLSGEIDIRP